MRRRAQIHRLTRSRDRDGPEVHSREHLLGLGVEFQAGQHLFMPHAAARIPIHDLDQLRNRMTAVTHDVAGGAACRGDQLAVHHEQAMVVALQESLDYHRPRMLASHGKALRHFFIGQEPDRNPAAVIAVVRLRHHGKPDALRGAHRLRLALDQFLLRHGQTQCGQDLVGLLLVAGQFDRDVRRAAGHGGLNALLILTMPQLHQGLIVEPQPGDAAVFRCAHQCGGRWAERPALREADELIACLDPGPVIGPRAGGPDSRGQQRTQQPQPEIARCDALVALRVFINDGIDPRRTAAAGLAEGDFLARHVLQFDGDVLQNVAKPGAFVFAHAPNKAPGFLVRAAVFGEAGQGGGQSVDETRPQAAGGPALESSQVHFEANDGKMRAQGWTDIAGTIENAHDLAPPLMRPLVAPLGYSLGWTSPPDAASRVRKLNVAPATRMCNRSPSTQTGCPSLPSPMDEKLTSDASTTVTPPLPSTSRVSSGLMKAAVSSSSPMPIANGLCARAVMRRPRRSRSRKCWSMMKRFVSPRPGASRTLPEITEEPSSPNAIMCSLNMLAPALVPPTVTPWALRTRISFATGVPPSRVVTRNWLPPVKNMPVASSSRRSRPGSWQSRRVSKSITVTCAAPRSRKSVS